MILLSSNRLDWKGLPGAKTLAYYEHSTFVNYGRKKFYNIGPWSNRPILFNSIEIAIIYEKLYRSKEHTVSGVLFVYYRIGNALFIVKYRSTHPPSLVYTYVCNKG